MATRGRTHVKSGVEGNAMDALVSSPQQVSGWLKPFLGVQGSILGWHNGHPGQNR